ncbi:MAG TPA: DedA family protein [Bryobacteraceae bacterium]|jgi:membrane protein DedA with SNARE-associated domain
MLETVILWITNYGYIALFALLILGIVGLPIPDETLMVFSGYLIQRGTFHGPQAFLTALCGSICGITLSYMIGRTLGLPAVNRYGKYIHFTPERLAIVLKWFERVGHWALFIGYYIAGVRHVSAIVAGTSGLSWPKFAIYAYSGAAVWVATFLTIGYYVGEKWESIAEEVHKNLTWISLVILGIAGLYLLYRWWSHRRKINAQ